MSQTFIQSQWGTVRGISMAISGCGPCSLASVISNSDKDINPKKMAVWLNDRGHFYTSGTTRSGITAALNAHGFECTYYKPEHSGGKIWQEAMQEMKGLKGDWWAILLVVGKKNGGKDNLWTAGGHFLTVTDLKNGKFYVRDSGAKRRTGYYSPELLRYDTNCIWVIRKKAQKKSYSGSWPVLPAKGYLGKGDVGETVKNLQLFLQWYGKYSAKIDKSFGNQTETAVKAFQTVEKLTVDGRFGPASLAKARQIKK